MRLSSYLLCSAALSMFAATPGPKPKLWILGPLVRPETPSVASKPANPVDAFIAAKYAAKGLKPVAQADKPTLLRRVYLDLIGIPPTPAEQDAFLKDESRDAYEKVVDKLLASDQHGVRYGRHWLDILRYADADEQMTAAGGIHYWRDWVINAVNNDLPYDQFVRAQLTGYRTTERTQMANVGVRTPRDPRPEDVFALGFLARGDVFRDNKNAQELPIAAVETVSTAFMGLTVGCAKCHDHMYDPIKQKDFYAMKALFDPLVIRKTTLASPAEIMAKGKQQEEAERKRAPFEKAVTEFAAPYKAKLYEDRVAMLPPDVKAIVLKPEKQRSPAEQKIADDYFPVLRIDSDKLEEAMPEADRKKFKELQKALQQANGGANFRGNGLPAFWSVAADPKRETETSYILTSGDADRPEKNHPVEPGWPFMPAGTDLREGRLMAFSDWLTSRDNTMFARVAVNRLWQWHFGEGLQKLSSDFGKLGGVPANADLLDWLASEFIQRNFSMKEINRLMVTSDTYKLASAADPKSSATAIKIDPEDKYLWRFRLQRLEAEPIWDSILTAAGDLDTTLGGPSFDPSPAPPGRRGGGRGGAQLDAKTNRRAAYMVRGFSTSREVVPNFLQSFDVDDGRVPCPMRTQTVTAPQSLFMMNSPEVDKASAKLAERMKKFGGEDLKASIDEGFRLTIGRTPSPSERDSALTYVEKNPDRLKGLAWLLFNLDEFIYFR